MLTIENVIEKLEPLAPLALAEEWDNVGLLVGDRRGKVERLMSCLTLTPITVAEAVDRRADLVVVHHPLPFRPVARLTTDTTVGRLLWELIGARVAIYSAHTAFDSAAGGINERLAAGLRLREISPLEPREPGGGAALTSNRGQTGNSRGTSSPPAGPPVGTGRCGVFDPPLKLADLAARLKEFLSLSQVRMVGAATQPVKRAGIVCGSGGSLLAAAIERGCDCFITGEATFHDCLEAEANGVALVLAGHYASERFAMEQLVGELSALLPGVEIWASERERDPIEII